jgi:hypothetical protein
MAGRSSHCRMCRYSSMGNDRRQSRCKRPRVCDRADSTKRQKPSLGYKSESYTKSRSGYKQWAHVLPREMRSFKHERLEQILNEIYCDTIFERACKPGYSIDLYCIRPRQEERISQPSLGRTLFRSGIRTSHCIFVNNFIIELFNHIGTSGSSRVCCHPSLVLRNPLRRPPFAVVDNRCFRRASAVEDGLHGFAAAPILG